MSSPLDSYQERFQVQHLFFNPDHTTLGMFENSLQCRRLIRASSRYKLVFIYPGAMTGAGEGRDIHSHTSAPLLIFDCHSPLDAIYFHSPAFRCH